jgi:hypothetical protein
LTTINTETGNPYIKFGEPISYVNSHGETVTIDLKNTIENWMPPRAMKPTITHARVGRIHGMPMSNSSSSKMLFAHPENYSVKPVPSNTQARQKLLNYGPREGHATMTNKKKGLFLTLVATSAFVLSSCNEVTALPKFYEDPIILNDDGTKTDVYQNIMSLIYDALTSSSDNPKKVLDEMMYVIAVDQFGSFAEVEELAAKDANAAEVRTFIEAHDNVYRDENDAEADKVANEFARLVHFKDTMDYRIKEVFHDAATGGSYSKRSRFDEEKYAVSLVGDLYDIEGVFEDATVWYKDVLVTPDVEVEDIVNFVHIDRYQDYIERGVLPRLYREKLVEQFIYDNNYSSLGRTYAREVEYIKIVNNDAYPSAAKSLINAFVDKYILDVNATDEVDFEVLANAWRGIDLSPDAVTLLETAFTGTSVPVTDPMSSPNSPDRASIIRRRSLVRSPGLSKDYR